MPTLKFVHLQKFLLMKNRRYIILNLKEVDKFSFPLKFQLEMKICPPCPPFLKYLRPNLTTGPKELKNFRFFAGGVIRCGKNRQF